MYLVTNLKLDSIFNTVNTRLIFSKLSLVKILNKKKFIITRARNLLQMPFIGGCSYEKNSSMETRFIQINHTLFYNFRSKLAYFAIFDNI